MFKNIKIRVGLILLIIGAILAFNNYLSESHRFLSEDISFHLSMTFIVLIILLLVMMWYGADVDPATRILLCCFPLLVSAAILYRLFIYLLEIGFFNHFTVENELSFIIPILIFGMIGGLACVINKLFLWLYKKANPEEKDGE